MAAQRCPACGIGKMQLKTFSDGSVAMRCDFCKYTAPYVPEPEVTETGPQPEQEQFAYLEE